MRKINNQRRIDDAIAHIKANIGRAIGLNDLASLAGMSRFHFAREFRAHSGITPMRCRTMARMECAKVKLVTRKKSISAVSASCGFASQSHMTRVFRATTGETPAAFRRRAFSCPE